MLTVLLIAALVAFAMLSLGIASAIFTTTVIGMGVSSASQNTVIGESAIIVNPDVAVAQAGVLTTRSTDSTGTLTMSSAGHGITTGMRFDLYWTGGRCYGCIAGTVSGTSVPIASVVGGSVFPIATTAITAGIITTVIFDIVGNNMTALAIVAGNSLFGYAAIANVGGDLFAVCVSDSGAYSWQASNGANPLAGVTSTKVHMSQSGVTSINTTMKLLALTN